MKVLVVDDDEAVRRLVSETMAEQGYQVWAAASGAEALELAAERNFDLVFSDVVMEGMTGFDLLRAFQKNLESGTEIVLITGQASVDAALEAVQFGATDYICKPISSGVLKEKAAACEQRRYPSRLVRIESASASQTEILGNSPPIIEAVKTAARIASTDLPVMICGESGTGKELLARLIHRRSARADKPFVAVNCGALPDSLLESELFGHTRGAFTGADSTRRGLFEEAHGGTLLLDEVTETSPAFQVKLLRTLQEGEVRPLGSNAKKRVNVRVIAATNRDPEALVQKGLFRHDLLYRLQGMSITLAPLRERGGDVCTLAFAMLSQYNNGSRQLFITKDALLALERYRWPGNVRELKHLMQRLATVSTGIIRIEDLPPEFVSTPTARSIIEDIVTEEELPTLDEMGTAYAHHVLNAVGGNKSRAARVLGVDRNTLYRMIQQRSNGSADEALS